MLFFFQQLIFSVNKMYNKNYILKKFDFCLIQDKIINLYLIYSLSLPFKLMKL